MRNNVTSQSRAFSVGLVLLFFVCLRAWAQVPLPFTDDFTGSTLNPAWQVLPGQGTYSVGGGQLRYNNVGTLASTTGWYNPALTLALPFTGTAWKIEIKATYSLKWLNSGTYTGPAVPTYSGSSGGQGPEVLVKFAPGVTTSGYGGPNYAGSDVTVIERGIDAWYGANFVSASYGAVSNDNFINPAAATIQNNIAGGTYWYQIIRNAGMLTINYSYDGINYVTAVSTPLSNPSSSYNELLIGGLTYQTAGSYTDYGYVHITGGSISAPTNLQATQIGNTGTQIQLTWDYGSDPIDGFEIERKTPSGDWPTSGIPVSLSNCSSTGSGLSCTYPDTVPSAYATYDYRVSAYKSGITSESSEDSWCYQIKVVLDNDANGYGDKPVIKAFFVPGATWTGVLQGTGYNHFNWFQKVTYDPAVMFDRDLRRLVAPYTDPPAGGYLGQVAHDNLPFYWDEPCCYPGSWLPNKMDATTLFFGDEPMEPSLRPGWPFDYVDFATGLVGVYADGTFDLLNTFAWSSTFNGSVGGVVVRSNEVPSSTPGSGGVFNVRQDVRVADLPISLRQSLVQAGARNVPVTPKIDKDAPVTAAFLSGSQGANGWYTGPVTVTLIATDIDGPSDIAATSYRLDGGAVIPYTAPFTVSGRGTHTIVFGSVDHALNAESPLPSQTFTITATALLAVTTASLPGGVVGAPYSQTLAATGGTPPYLWTVSAGRLPVGLTLNAATGQITGTPTNPVSSLVTFKVTDAGVPAQTTAVQLTFTILPNTLTITTSSLPKGQVGIAYSQTVATIGGTTPFTWEFAGGGALPPGLTLNTLTGQISGTPTVAVTNYRLLLRVTDSTTPTPQSAAAAFTLTIAPGSSPM